MTALKTLLFMLIVPGIAGYYVPVRLIEPATRGANVALGPLRYVALVLWAAGLALLVWTAGEFVTRGHGTPLPLDAPKDLMVRGPYRYMRNPMYVGALLVLAGHVVWFGSPWLLAYLALIFLGFQLFVMLYEEPTLRRRFGDAYARYYRVVPRWPWSRRPHPGPGS